ncbi:MAG: LacI family DNA-binding transcriptional regulator [Pseudomonadota bacterium]
MSSIPPVPTLADVARRAGVSTATVSRCLNSPGQVNEGTRTRVMQAVRDLGYAPNFGARALAAKQTNTVGVVIPTMENAVFARGIQAFQNALGHAGKTLLIASSAYQPELEDEQVRTLVARGADALLLIGYEREPSLFDFLARRGVPALVAWSFDETQSHPAIGFDNRASMEELARLVLQYGHTHVACISAPTGPNDRARGRVQGIRHAMDSAGLPAQNLYLTEVDYGIDTGAAALRHVLSAAPATTVVMCGNDVLAIGALRAAREMGLRVPEDLSITGFDDIDLAMLAEPALTTVHVPHREMGRRAAGQLVQALEQGTPLKSVRLATDIRVRQSLGPVPKG